jgi:hypothetical protein
MAGPHPSCGAYLACRRSRALRFACATHPATRGGGARIASKIGIRQRDTGTLLGYFYTPLEPDAVRQHLTAEGMRAFAEDVGIYIPEINDPQETPFYGRPDSIVGKITAIEPSAYQTILDREQR